MKSDDQQSKSHGFLKDIVVFIVTVTSCTVLITAAVTIAKPVDAVVELAPISALPLPPAQLLPEPAPDFADLAVELATAAAMTMIEIVPTPTKAVQQKDSPYHSIITQVAGRYEVDPHLIRAIIFAESGYNPKAKSKKGARGLMQLMPSTAQSLGVENIYDPEENIDGGVRYFRLLLDRFNGDIQLALAAYNAGSRHVLNYQGIPPFKATQLYIKKVLKFHKKFKVEMAAGPRELA